MLNGTETFECKRYAPIAGYVRQRTDGQGHPSYSEHIEVGRLVALARSSLGAKDDCFAQVQLVVGQSQVALDDV